LTPHLRDSKGQTVRSKATVMGPLRADGSVERQVGVWHRVTVLGLAIPAPWRIYFPLEGWTDSGVNFFVLNEVVSRENVFAYWVGTGSYETAVQNCMGGRNVFGSASFPGAEPL